MTQGHWATVLMLMSGGYAEGVHGPVTRSGGYRVACHSLSCLEVISLLSFTHTHTRSLPQQLPHSHNHTNTHTQTIQQKMNDIPVVGKSQSQRKYFKLKIRLTFRCISVLVLYYFQALQRNKTIFATLYKQKRALSPSKLCQCYTVVLQFFEC